MLKDQLIDFMKSFEKDHDDFRLYVTFDHVLLHVKDFTAVNYSDEQGLRDLLEYLVRAGWERAGRKMACSLAPRRMTRR